MCQKLSARPQRGISGQSLFRNHARVLLQKREAKFRVVQHFIFGIIRKSHNVIGPIVRDFDEPIVECPMMEFAKAHTVLSMVKVDLRPRNDMRRVDSRIAAGSQRQKAKPTHDAR